MVYILASGEIVADDDPRAQQSRRPRPSAQPQAGVGQLRGHVQQGQHGQQGQQINLFTVLNQKLKGMGIPPWSLGDLVVEPIVTVGFLLALFMFGLPGLIFGAILFAVSHWSTHGAPEPVRQLFAGLGLGADQGQRPQQGNQRRPQTRGGGGHTLGRD